MIKAVFFDWSYTLVYSKPSPQGVYGGVYQKFGVELDPQLIMKGLALAEKQLADGNPVKWRKSADEEVFIRYQEILLAEWGVTLPRDILSQVIRNLKKAADEITVVLYDDTLPTLRALEKRGLTLGLITNMERGMNFNYRELGLATYLKVVVTSDEAGANKPKPPIFLLALKKAAVKPAEAIYVGDQYGTDILGAKGAGINPILLDRGNLFPEVSDCPRIERLSEVVDYV
ncbi:MAG: HAD-IA family hydrolase [Dehalococcoidales bacterium]|nr:HAD-IA family hydrolase [Dehalococcoidales bacterium]